jgi:hypothetical protein
LADPLSAAGIPGAPYIINFQLREECLKLLQLNSLECPSPEMRQSVLRSVSTVLARRKDGHRHPTGLTRAGLISRYYIAT